jgi:hypothetical protein
VESRTVRNTPKGVTSTTHASISKSASLMDG